MSGDPLDNVPVEAWSELRAERDALQAEVERLNRALDQMAEEWRRTLYVSKELDERVAQLEQALREITRGPSEAMRGVAFDALYSDQQGGE